MFDIGRMEVAKAGKWPFFSGKNRSFHLVARGQNGYTDGSVDGPISRPFG